MDGGGRQILERAPIGQPVGESSRRRPHPQEGLGRHRAGRHCATPYGLAAETIALHYPRAVHAFEPTQRKRTRAAQGR